MTDPIEISPEARLAVVAGFAYAGPINRFANEGEWRQKMNQGAVVAAAAMNGKAARLAQEVLDADVIKGDYRGYTLEESSTRLIVEIYTGTTSRFAKRDDGVDELRTDRTDTQMGKAMQRRLDGLPVGATILAFKYNEQMSGQETKVRIIKHFEVLNINKDSASSSAPASAPAPEVGPPSNPPEPAGAPPAQVAPAGKNDGDLVIRIAALSGPVAAKLARAARAEGIENIVAAKWATRVEQLLDELEDQ